MTQLNEHLIAHVSPVAIKENIFLKGDSRITVLTPSLIRCEVEPNGKFTDEATQTFWYRSLPAVNFSVEEKGNIVEITTEKAVFHYDKNAKAITKVKLDNNWITCDNKQNLKGTRRTLDFCIGAVKIGDGLVSENGVAVYEDNSLILVDGATKARPNPEKDVYIFAYGKNYRECIKDLYRLTGEVPLLPRYVLGNWWSRYRAYTQKEYLDLMARFEREKLPFTVATVDMDWHWVDVNKRFGGNMKGANIANGAGWTGYSWNTELFPDYKKFLNTLHEHNYKVTLNLHPASGIRFYEDCYPEMARAMDIDPETKQPVNFNLADNKFINNYFDIVHHPFEDDGVNFWWIDWQQGKKSTVANLDPLWALNHYHYLDNCRNGDRGLILSRYSGLGSHRYPLGFSGDTFVFWSNLNFQPYFTSTASNVGYGWWSHDIGGHHFGINNDELYLRWCQFGVFSPINRLHSTTHDLFGKEPWKRCETVRRITNDFLRLRHALIPYLYTMNYLSNKEGRSLCEPMYYSYPDDKESYLVPNQYTFGTELIVAPITSPVDTKINMSKTDVWFPEGRWTDIFTGKIYYGNKKVTVFRDLTSIPVFAKEGAIIPMSDTKDNKVGNPSEIKLFVYRGNGSFTMYEDDGESKKYLDGESVSTQYTVSENGKTVKFSIKPAAGKLDLIPEIRSYTICFKDIIGGNLKFNDVSMDCDGDITLNVDTAVGVDMEITDCVFTENGDPMENGKLVLSRYQCGNIRRMLRYGLRHRIKDADEFYNSIQKSKFPKVIKLAVKEAMDK